MPRSNLQPRCHASTLLLELQLHAVDLLLAIDDPRCYAAALLLELQLYVVALLLELDLHLLRMLLTPPLQNWEVMK
jgi:hypothetical protein